jgi:hypothetical protein
MEGKVHHHVYKPLNLTPKQLKQILFSTFYFPKYNIITVQYLSLILPVWFMSFGLSVQNFIGLSIYYFRVYVTSPAHLILFV